MAFHLHDSLTGSKIPLPARTPGEVSIYLCGPTVYNFIHVGNGRPAVVFDVLARHLRASGLKVTFVRNFTDVDDKIIKASTENNEEPAALAQRFVEAYLTDTAALGCRRPDAEPRVSQFIPEIVEMIRALISRGHAYERDGDVYFSVRTFDKYGALSKRNLEDLRAGERVAVDERKDDPLDFALWKKAKTHEPAGARWESPWGEGRPGWHIECSAMSRKVLGPGFDVHAGGMDLIFPHHENEIAQSVCATGDAFCSAWMHNGFVQLRKNRPEGEGDGNDEEGKISKSKLKQMGWISRYFILRNLLDLVHPEAVRFWLLSTQYRSPLDFELAVDEKAAAEAEHSHAEGQSPPVKFPALEEAERRVEYFYETRMRLEARAAQLAGKQTPAPKEALPGEKLRREFDAALDDDLNTANALAPLSETFKRANEFCDSNKKDPHLARSLLETVKHMGAVLGIAEGDGEAYVATVNRRRAIGRGMVPADIDRLVAERSAARAARDFARADAIRTELLARGIDVRDNPTGSTWRAM